ncbi:hypothetical protein EJB05_32655, partial [Eragrostis curvula]
MALPEKACCGCSAARSAPAGAYHCRQAGRAEVVRRNSSEQQSVEPKEGVLHINMSYGYGDHEYSSFLPSSFMSTTSISAIAVLLDSGNLVIRDQPYVCTSCNETTKPRRSDCSISTWRISPYYYCTDCCVQMQKKTNEG